MRKHKHRVFKVKSMLSRVWRALEGHEDGEEARPYEAATGGGFLSMGSVWEESGVSVLLTKSRRCPPAELVGFSGRVDSPWCPRGGKFQLGEEDLAWVGVARNSLSEVC